MADLSLSLTASGNNWLYIGSMYSNGRPEYYNVNLVFTPTKYLSKVVINLAYGGWNGSNTYRYSVNGVTGSTFSWSGDKTAKITITQTFVANTEYTINIHVTTANLGYVQLSSYSATGTEAPTYSISYKGNAKNSGTVSNLPSAQTKISDVSLTLSSSKPTHSNTTASGYKITFNGNGGTPSKTSATATNTTKYTFSKWNTAAAGTGTSYSAGASYTANAAATLYAQWSSSTTKGSITAATATRSNGTSTRTVTFDVATNGGTCSTTSLDSTATITYTMKGWFEATSGGTAVATSGGSYTPSAAKTLYAQWGSSTGTYSAISLPSASKANGSSTRTITFDAATNGGTCSTESLKSTATITHSFNGWYDTASGGTLIGKGGASITPSVTDTYYAQFGSSTGTFSAITLPTATKDKSTSSVAVTINANGGATTVASCSSTKTTTYSLKGWYDAASGGTLIGKGGASITPSVTDTYYAQFGSSISFSGVTLPTKEQCTREGYTLLGFATSNTATEVEYNPGAKYTPTGAVTLYAIWMMSGLVALYEAVNNPQSYQAYIYDEENKFNLYAPYVWSNGEWKLNV